MYWVKCIHPLGQILNFDDQRESQNRGTEHMHAPIHVVQAWINTFEWLYKPVYKPVYAALALGIHSCMFLFPEVTMQNCSGK